MPEETLKVKAKKPVKFLIEELNPLDSLKPGSYWVENGTITSHYIQQVEKAKLEKAFKEKQTKPPFPGGMGSLLDPQVKNWCGVEGFNAACWAEICFLFVDKILVAQAFFVYSGDRDKWIEAATKYCKTLKAKEAFIQKLRYYPGSQEVQINEISLETGKEELYLNGPKANKDKLNEFLHKVGKHHV